LLDDDNTIEFMNVSQETYPATSLANNDQNKKAKTATTMETEYTAPKRTHTQFAPMDNNILTKLNNPYKKHSRITINKPNKVTQQRIQTQDNGDEDDKDDEAFQVTNTMTDIQDNVRHKTS
jgi:hypothetical protein